MLNQPRLTITDLERMCQEKAEEGLTLEFKPCNELIIGSQFYDQEKGCHRERTRDDVVRELTRDVSAFLNATGGRIVYGIRERDGRALELDADNVFQEAGQSRVTTERLAEWLHAHMHPSVTLDIYRVFASDDRSSWYLVLDVPQGEQAYQAWDKRFYRRSGSTPKPMEQYEIVDVMNRAKGAAIETLLLIKRVVRQRERIDVHVEVRLTSGNHITSEQGEVKFSIIAPLRVWTSPYLVTDSLRSGTTEEFILPDGTKTYTECSWYRYRWGHFGPGEAIFPDDWRSVEIILRYPRPDIEAEVRSLVSVDAYTLNRRRVSSYYVMRWPVSSESPELIDWSDLDQSEKDSLLEAFAPLAG